MYTQTDFVHNNMQDITEEFLQGKEFDPRLSKVVLNNIDLLDPADYDDMLRKVKGVLTRAKTKHYDNFFFIDTPEEISNKEKAVLIRYVNLCYQHKSLILFLNDALIYLPVKYKVYDTSEVDKYIFKTLKAKEHSELIHHYLNQYRAFKKKLLRALNPFRTRLA